MFSESAIAKAVKQIAASIVSDYDDLSQLVLVGVMNGSVFFLHDLIQELREQESGECVQEVTARMESYKGIGPKGVRCISLPSPSDINKRDVLIVDDIVNTGATSACLKSELVENGRQFREDLRRAIQLQSATLCCGSELLRIRGAAHALGGLRAGL